MSHEIRTHVNSIIGINYLATKQQNPTEHLKSIGRAASHMQTVINDLVDINQIEQGNLPFKEETFYKSNDQLFSKGYLEQRTSYRTGTWQWFYSNGNKMRYINYSSGRIVGFLSTYNSNGHLMESYSYNKSRPGEMPFNYKFKKDNDGTLRIAKGKGPFNGAYVGNDKNIDSLSGNYKDHKATGLWKAYKNGVLIYVAVEDKTFVIYGDKGINDVVPDNFWDSTKDIMQSHFKDGNFKQGLIDGILKAGQQLEKHFPWIHGDINELPNDISKG